MIPLRDDQPTRRFPAINWLLILANVLVFLFEFMLSPDGLENFIYSYGLIPSALVANTAANWVSIFTSMFLHGSWLHLIFNMLALYIFGDNIEDRLGHFRYLAFYLLGGVGASLIHVWAYPSSTLPTVGASGAIAAVLGAYMVLYPRARVVTLIPIFFFIRIVNIPAILYLGFWFVSQLFNGASQIAAGTFQGGGVAWWAHIGGFVTGIILIILMAPRRKKRKSTVWDNPEVIVAMPEEHETLNSSSRWYSSG
jgi:membrane associated rhomboid family serine protease